MEIIRKLAQGFYIESTPDQKDWSQFHLKYGGGVIHLGAESKKHVEQKLAEFTPDYQEGKTIFFINFSETHTTLYIRCERGLFFIIARDSNGSILFKEEYAGVN